MADISHQRPSALLPGIVRTPDRTQSLGCVKPCCLLHIISQAFFSPSHPPTSSNFLPLERWSLGQPKRFGIVPINAESKTLKARQWNSLGNGFSSRLGLTKELCPLGRADPCSGGFLLSPSHFPAQAQPSAATWLWGVPVGSKRAWRALGSLGHPGWCWHQIPAAGGARPAPGATSSIPVNQPKHGLELIHAQDPQQERRICHLITRNQSGSKGSLINPVSY